MRIIIAGAGQVGIGLARYLRAENHDIVLIDNNADCLNELSEQLDIQTIQGSSAYPAILEKAGADRADIFLAVTGSDETNIVACGVANSIFHIPQRIARISAHEYLQQKYKAFLDEQKIDIVLSPEMETARHVLDNLSVAGTSELVKLAGGTVLLIGLRCKKNSPMYGKKIAEIEALATNFKFKIVALKRRDNLMDLKETTVRLGDDVFFVTDTHDKQYILDILACESLKPEYILIFGGGKVGYRLARTMEEEHFSKNITIVEKNEERAHFLAQKLQKTLVINADGLDDAIVDDLNLHNYQVSIATTQSDESNILLSMISKRSGIDRTCALIHNPLYNDLILGMGIDITLDPNAILVSAILQHIRKGRVKNDYFISSGIGEILEIEALKTSKITKSPLGKLKIPEGVVIGGVIREGVFLVPDKTLQVQDKDVVIVFVQKGRVKEVEQLFTVGFSFF